MDQDEPPPPPYRSAELLQFCGAVRRTIQFHLNRAVYGGCKSVDAACSKSPLVREVTVFTAKGQARLPYSINRDNDAIWRGIQPAWLHLSDLDTAGDSRTNIKIIRLLLAQLPSKASFIFIFSPFLKDVAGTKVAFEAAGFTTSERKTFLWNPKSATNALEALTGKSIKGTLRRAQRDLEIRYITAAEFFAFHSETIAAAGKHDYRVGSSDAAMLAECVKNGTARIIAACKKTASPPGRGSFDAAVACVWDKSDLTYKLWRMAYRPKGDGPDEPHPDATKLLLLATMNHAAEEGLVLDTDGCTPGLEHFYSLFGPEVFQCRMRLHCDRETLHAYIHKRYPSIFAKLFRRGKFDSRSN